MFKCLTESTVLGTFLELLEPYILKDMLSGLAPEVTNPYAFCSSPLFSRLCLSWLRIPGQFFFKASWTKSLLSGQQVMQALVEHYSSRGWLNRVEQCVLHMDIASLDFNQVHSYSTRTQIIETILFFTLQTIF